MAKPTTCWQQVLTLAATPPFKYFYRHWNYRPKTSCKRTQASTLMIFHCMVVRKQGKCYGPLSLLFCYIYNFISCLQLNSQWLVSFIRRIRIQNSNPLIFNYRIEKEKGMFHIVITMKTCFASEMLILMFKNIIHLIFLVFGMLYAYMQQSLIGNNS